MTEVERMPSGLTVREARRHAATWWDRRGRHVVKNPEFRNPDVGFRSGILRGLEWELLTGEEQAKVTMQWDVDHGHALVMERQMAGAR